MCLEQLRSTGRKEVSSGGDMERAMEKRMRDERRLWRALLDDVVLRNILSDKGGEEWGEFFLRFADVLFTILEILAQTHVRRPSPICLGPHEDKSRLQDFISHGRVVHPHVLPQVVHHRLHWDRSIRENIAPHDWHQSVVICLAIIKRHVVKNIYADQTHAPHVDEWTYRQ